MANGRQPVLGRMLGGTTTHQQRPFNIQADPIELTLGASQTRKASPDVEAANHLKLQERQLIEKEKEIATHGVAEDFFFTDESGNQISRSTLEDQGVDTSGIAWDTRKSPSALRHDNQIAIEMNGKIVNVDDASRQPIHNKSGQVVGYYSDYVKPETYYSDERREELIDANYIRDMESLGYGRKEIENALAHMKLVGMYDSKYNQQGSRTWAEYTKNLKIRKYNHDELVSLIESGHITQPTIAGAKEHDYLMSNAKEFKTDIRAWTPPIVTTGDEGERKSASNQATKMPHEMDAAQKGLKSFSYQNMINNPQQPVIGEGWLDGVEEKAVHIDQPFYISENMGEQFKKTSNQTEILARDQRLVYDPEGVQLFDAGVKSITLEDDTFRGTPQSYGQIFYKHAKANIPESSSYDTATSNDIIRFLADAGLINFDEASFKELTGDQKQGYRLAAQAYYNSVIKPEIVAAQEAYKETYGSQYMQVVEHYWDGMNEFAAQRQKDVQKLQMVQANIWQTPQGTELMERAQGIDIFTDKFLQETEGQVSINHVIKSLAGTTYQEKVNQLRAWEDQGWLTPAGVDFGYRVINYQEEQTSELRRQIKEWDNLLDIKEVPQHSNDEGYKPGLTWLPGRSIDPDNHAGTLAQGTVYNPNTKEWSFVGESFYGEDRRLQVTLLDNMSIDYGNNKLKYVGSDGKSKISEVKYVKQLLKKDPEVLKNHFSDELANWTLQDIKAIKDTLLGMEDDALEDTLYRLKQVKIVPYKEKKTLYKEKDKLVSEDDAVGLGSDKGFRIVPGIGNWQRDLRRKGEEYLRRHGQLEE